MARRARGEGTIFPFTQNGKRKWRAQITWRDERGRRKRRSRIADSQAAAKVLLHELQAELTGGGLSASSMTVAGFLAHWLETKIAPNRAAATLDSYTRAVENHIVPHIGDELLHELDLVHIERLLTALADVGSRTRENAFVVLRAALNHAVKVQRLKSNPCLYAERPVHRRKNIRPFTADETRKILAATETHRLHALFALAFHLGLRQEELFALRWDCVDFETETLRIERAVVEIAGNLSVKETPKNEASRRTLPLAGATLEAMIEHRRRTMAEGQAANPLVFPNRRGGYIRLGVFRTRIWQPLLKRLGIDYRGFHHTRHSFATAALSAGEDILSVSRLLGHARPSTSLDTYGTWLPSKQKEVAERVSRRLG